MICMHQRVRKTLTFELISNVGSGHSFYSVRAVFFDMTKAT
jgi:hypothetical protein